MCFGGVLAGLNVVNVGCLFSLGVFICIDLLSCLCCLWSTCVDVSCAWI